MSDRLLGRREGRALPANISPRGLTREQAAEYCGCETVDAFSDWVRRGIVPGPIRGTTRWDRRQIDRWLDRRWGEPVNDAEMSPDEWLAAHAS